VFKIPLVFVFLLLYNSIISLQAIAVFSRYRNKEISIIGALTSFAVGFYSFGYAMELLNLMSSDIANAFFGIKCSILLFRIFQCSGISLFQLSQEEKLQERKLQYSLFLLSL